MGKFKELYESFDQTSNQSNLDEALSLNPIYKSVMKGLRKGDLYGQKDANVPFLAYLEKVTSTPERIAGFIKDVSDRTDESEGQVMIWLLNHLMNIQSKADRIEDNIDRKRKQVETILQKMQD
jgi:hypothetical protein